MDSNQSRYINFVLNYNSHNTI